MPCGYQGEELPLSDPLSLAEALFVALIVGAFMFLVTYLGSSGAASEEDPNDDAKLRFRWLRARGRPRP